MFEWIGTASPLRLVAEQLSTMSFRTWHCSTKRAMTFLLRRTSDSVFFGYHRESELFANERRFWAFIRRAIWLEANLNVKRENGISGQRAEKHNAAPAQMQTRSLKTALWKIVSAIASLEHRQDA